MTNIKLWNNKKLGLSYQSELERIPKEKIKEILNSYERSCTGII